MAFRTNKIDQKAFNIKYNNIKYNKFAIFNL